MFLQSCFIKSNTPRLRERLHILGYNVKEISLRSECIATAPNVSKAVGVSEDMFDDNNPHRTWNCNGRIDCGTDEYLFLAIAALRNDTDKNQWFTDGGDDFWYISGDDNNDSTVKYYKERYNRKIHKATIKELINHFKKE